MCEGCFTVIVICSAVTVRNIQLDSTPGTAFTVLADLSDSRLTVGQCSITTSWQTSLLHYTNSCDGTSLPLTVHPGYQSDGILLVSL